MGRRKHLQTAVMSALQQEGIFPGSAELILVTDQTPPDTGSLPSSVSLRTVSVPYGTILGDAVRQAVKESRADVLCFLDDDDLFAPGKVAAVVEAFSKSATVGFYSNNFTVIDDTGRELTSSKFRVDVRRARASCGPLRLSQPGVLARLRELPPVSPEFNSSTISIRRSILTPERLSVLATLTRAVDSFYFFAAIAAGMDVVLDARVLTAYRLHAQNLPLAKRMPPHPPDHAADLLVHNKLLTKDFLAIRAGLFEDNPFGQEAARALLAVSTYADYFALLNIPGASRMDWFKMLERVLGARSVWSSHVKARLVVPALACLCSPKLARLIFRWAQTASRS